MVPANRPTGPRVPGSPACDRPWAAARTRTIHRFRPINPARRLKNGWPLRNALTTSSDRRFLCGMALIALLIVVPEVRGEERQAAERYREQARPILAEYCLGCHGEGRKKGNVAFDGDRAEDALVRDRD